MSKFLTAIASVAVITIISGLFSSRIQRKHYLDAAESGGGALQSVIARHIFFFVLVLPWLYLLFTHPKHALIYWVILIIIEYFMLVYWFKSKIAKR